MNKGATILTQEQIASFHRDGYLGPLPAVASDALLTGLARDLTRVELDKLRHPLYGRFSSRDWHLVDDRLMELIAHPTVVGALRQLMGDDLLVWRSSTFIKPPFGSEIGWHQEWGTFAGLEYGNDIPSLRPMPPIQEPWNVTIWFALVDVAEEMGPIQFIRGSHNHQYPVAQVAMPESAFFDPTFGGIDDPQEFVRRARAHTLVIDIDTSKFFENVDIETLTLEKAKRIVIDGLSRLTGEIALPFDIVPDTLVTMPMKRGEYVIFYERTMHGSGPNRTAKPRSAVNFRVTPSSTLIYPQRLEGRYMDGSNLDIRHHHCILLNGCSRNDANVFRESVPATTADGAPLPLPYASGR